MPVYSYTGITRCFTGYLFLRVKLFNSPCFFFGGRVAAGDAGVLGLEGVEALVVVGLALFLLLPLRLHLLRRLQLQVVKAAALLLNHVVTCGEDRNK